MATVITLPKIIGLDKEQCVPEGNQRLWNYFGVEGYSVKHSKIFEPYLFMPTNKSNLPYQKMVDRYQFLTSDGVKPQCAPLCQEGWYFDCETETCKEYSGYIVDLASLIGTKLITTMWLHEQGGIKSVGTRYTMSHNCCIVNIDDRQSYIGNTPYQGVYESMFVGGWTEGFSSNHNVPFTETLGIRNKLPSDVFIGQYSYSIRNTYGCLCSPETINETEDGILGSNFPCYYDPWNDFVLDRTDEFIIQVYGVK